MHKNFRNYSRSVNDFMNPISDFLSYLDFSHNSSININVDEYENYIELTAEIPGFTKNEVNISFENSILTISGKKMSEEKLGAKSHIKEIRLNSFKRSFDVDVDIKEENVKAKIENGLLIIQLQKEKVKSGGNVITVE